MHREQTIASAENRKIAANNKLVCFFCNSLIKSREVISIKSEKFYHRHCFDSLFTLKIDEILTEKDF